MFAPNRLITPKEQWLLVGVIVVVITGCVTLYFHDANPTGASEPPTPIMQVAPAVATAQPLAVEAVPTTTPAPPNTTSGLPSAAEERPETPTPDRTPQVIGVAVMGAVQHPGLYTVDADMRVSDLIAVAGGTTAHADLSDILLTAPLVDETTLTIPEYGTVSRDEQQISVRRGERSVALNPPWYRKGGITAAVAASPGHAAAPRSIAQPSVATLPPMPTGVGFININYATAEELQQLPGIGPVLAGRIIEERQRGPFLSVEELRRVPGIADKRLDALRPMITAP